jgi:7-carboxy-7-deazaguanine synthase (Cx14CxxC type)
MNVNEIFYSIQGEGYWSGRAAIFVRFSGCNMWSGGEENRAKGRGWCAKWCDTDFVSFTEMSEIEIVNAVKALASNRPMVVFTGGEPCLQLTSSLVQSIKSLGLFTAVETNGTIRVPTGVDWVTVSPKILPAMMRQQHGNELKFVWPNVAHAKGVLSPDAYSMLEFDHFFLQPVDSAEIPNARMECVEYVKAHPQWRVSLQIHKELGQR